MGYLIEVEEWVNHWFDEDVLVDRGVWAKFLPISLGREGCPVKDIKFCIAAILFKGGEDESGFDPDVFFGRRIASFGNVKDGMVGGV